MTISSFGRITESEAVADLVGDDCGFVVQLPAATEGSIAVWRRRAANDTSTHRSRGNPM
jgi:hypothetical protein